jgi:hypothetical protein
MPTRYPRARTGNRQRSGWASAVGGTALGVFFFFSNRLGCLGSIMLSIVLTVVLLAILSIL